MLVENVPLRENRTETKLFQKSSCFHFHGNVQICINNDRWQNRLWQQKSKVLMVTKKPLVVTCESSKKINGQAFKLNLLTRAKFLHEMLILQ